MASSDKRVFHTPEQNERIRRAVEKSERNQPYFRPQAIKPRFSGGRPGQPLVYFQLEEELTFQIGHAEARLLKQASAASNTYIVDDSKDPIEVYDIFRRNSDPPEVDSPGMWAGKKGYRGWAIKRNGATPWLDEGESGGTDDDERRDKYAIVWMEQIAERIMVQIVEPVNLSLSGGTVECHIVRYDGQGIDPAGTFESPGEDTLTVHVPFFFDDIVENAYGFAEYDYSERKYYLVECTRVAVFARATLTEEMCGNEWPSGDVDISGFNIIPHGWHIQNPPATPTKATNRRGHAGSTGLEVLLMRTGLASLSEGDDASDQTFTWDIIDVTQRETQIIFDLMWGVNESVETAIQYKKRTVRMEFCDPEDDPEWITLVVAKNCTGTEE